MIKYILVLIVFLLVFVMTSNAQVTQSCSGSAVSNVASCTYGSNVQAGDILVLNSKTSSATATVGSTATVTGTGVCTNWVAVDTTYVDGGGSSFTTTLQYCIVPTTGAESVQVSWANNLGSAFTDIQAPEYAQPNGYTFNGLDVSSNSKTAGGHTTPCQATPITPSNKPDLLVSVCNNWDNGQTWPAVTGYTNEAGSSTVTKGWYDKFSTSASSQSFSASITADYWINQFAAFKLNASHLWSGVIDTNRAIDWNLYSGIPGGIPNLVTQCGAALIPGASAATILGAINHTGTGYTGCAANTYVQLTAGTFNLSNGIYCTSCNFTELRGMGADKTHLVFSSAATCQGGNGSCGFGTDNPGNNDPSSPGTVVNWTAGYAKGSTQITLSNVQQITANSTLILLDQCDTGYTGDPCTGTATDNGGYYNCGDKYATSGPHGCSVNGQDTGFARPNRLQWEIVQATSCTPACGTNAPGTVNINVPIENPNWASGLTPRAWFIDPSKKVGIRNMSLDLSATTATAGVSHKNCAQCYVQGVSVLHSNNIGIWLIQAFQNQLESNYIYDAGQNLNNADPTGIKYNGSDNAIVNNIIHKVRPFFLPEGPANGNVIVGNAGFNSYTNDDFMFGGVWDGHSNGTNYNLIEGNTTNQLTGDLIHGGHLMTSWYRNLATGFESCANHQCGAFSAKGSDQSAVATQAFSRYANYIGNVLGTPGYTNTYAPSTANCNGTGSGGNYIYNNMTWVISCGNSGGSVPIPGDTVGQSTTMRWGNFDLANNSVQYNTAEVPSGSSTFPNPVPTLTCITGINCPSSFYYSSRPSWWINTIPFPAIGPDISSGNLGICSGTLNTSTHYSGVPATSNANCVFTTLSSAWSGHVNANPAMNCFLNVMNGPPDGAASTLTFSADTCYSNPIGTNKPSTLLLLGTD